MRWITDDKEFESVFLDTQECVFIDSHREPTPLICLEFGDLEIVTDFFASLILKMMRWAGDANAFYVILRPDPILYFYRHFRKYPALEIELHDTAASYLDALNEDPGGSPADAVGTNWWTCVIVPPTRKWFVHVLRSDSSNSGHLWVPSSWTQPLTELHPGLKPKPFCGPKGTNGT
jgi:hypothetical protein